MNINVYEQTGDFAEDKDSAATIREEILRPALKSGARVTIDFEGVRLATQSFVHALIADVLRSEGEKALDIMEFKNCHKSVRGIVETVVQYALETMDDA